AAQQIVLARIKLHSRSKQFFARHAIAGCYCIGRIRASEFPTQSPRYKMSCRKLQCVSSVKRAVAAQRAAEIARAHPQAAVDNVNRTDNVASRNVYLCLRHGLVFVQTELVVHSPAR